MMTSDKTPDRPSDWREREQATDIALSCIVQAPAGSGKTELLIQRILSLLAVADNPEEILSITFTRKAAGEMRLRLLEALERALDDQPPTDAHARETWQRARSVLERDRQKSWNLLKNPTRLQLTTIDSFCAFLTRRMPWMARFGEQPRVTDDPSDIYTQAAEALLQNLEKGGPGQQATETLLVHLDNQLALLRDLLVAMLGKRDQWLRHLLCRRDQKPRQVLEDGLTLYVSAFLEKAYRTLGVKVYSEIRELGAYAAVNLGEATEENPLAPLIEEKESPGSLSQWLAITHLILTADGHVRKGVNKTVGFPADKSPIAQGMKARAKMLLEEIGENPAASEVLQSLRKLPATCYDEEQWHVLEALIELLPLTVAHLQQVFRLKGVVDFIEVSSAAKSALGSATDPEELLLQLDSRIQHILVDEFQDTSYAQYDLLRCLTAGWMPGDGRTLFVVGDPMQSIYRFREAEVGLYLRVCQRGLDSLPMERIVLNTNFRSSKTLVDWTNSAFRQLFPADEDELHGAVSFAAATAFSQQEKGSKVSFNCFIDRQDKQEADIVVKLVRQAHENHPSGTTAILVRSRTHLAEIVKQLKCAGISYQAQDIDPLKERPVVQDILSLARALCRPADRVAWLSVLRAPWCGLGLDDLTFLCGKDAKTTVWKLLSQTETQAEMFDHLSADGRARLDRILPVLGQALRNLGRIPLHRLVESTWLALNGPACVESADLQDAARTFELLGALDQEKGLADLEQSLARLFAAPDASQVSQKLQLMTIHKAKGLEFDTVILPGLGRGVPGQDKALLRWLEHPDFELLLAPVPPLLSDQKEPTYTAIGRILQEKDNLETIRLLYVAATRAKKHLHLLGHASEQKSGELKPLSGSLLSALWPAVEDDFAANVSLSQEAGPEELSPRYLRRLPLQWIAPQFPAKLHIPGQTVQLASGGGHYAEERLRSRRTEEGRAVGTLVHSYLEQIAIEGVSTWSEERVAKELETFEVRLNMHGVPRARLGTCAQSVSTCLINTITSQRGRWLLDCHREANCELPVNGIVDGQLVRATIDRTFLDQDGVRWIVDYKTSAPKGSEEPVVFMEKEVDRYREQLILYQQLIGQMKEQEELKTALYFPVFDGWLEVEL